MKYQEKKFYYVDYGDLEQKIEEVYGRSYEIPCNEECGNDVSLQFTASGTNSVGWQVDKVNDFTSGKGGMYILDCILNDMAFNGHIPDGNWIVRVSW